MNNQKPWILVITELYPNLNILFLGAFVQNQLKALEKYYNIAVIVPVSFKTKIEKSVVKDGDISIHYLKCHLSTFLLNAEKFVFNRRYDEKSRKKSFLRMEIVSKAKKLHSRYHFSLVHGHEVYIGDEAAVVGRTLNIPSLVTIHNLYEYHVSCFGPDAMKQVVNNLNLADKLIAVSKMTACSYKEQGIEKEIQVIPNGIGNSKIKPIPEQWKRITENKTVILAVGFFAHIKRIEQVLYAAIELKKRQGNSFVILILGAGSLENFYRDIIRNARLEDQIYIVGQIPPPEIMAYFTASDFLVHPCVLESFSMVCLEAMAAGKPFICTKNIGITEYITNGKEAFIIPADNLASLTEKMDILLQNRKLRERMGQAAQETSLKFGWNDLAPEILRVYDRLINNHG